MRYEYVDDYNKSERSHQFMDNYVRDIQLITDRSYLKMQEATKSQAENKLSSPQEIYQNALIRIGKNQNNLRVIFNEDINLPGYPEKINKILTDFKKKSNNLLEYQK